MGPRSATAEIGPLEVMQQRSQSASMGPRSRDRGNAEWHTAASATMRTLQWGRGRATAEIQSRRRPSIAWALEASMGPRSRDRGNLDARNAACQRSESASMGPRSRDRGNVIDRCGCRRIRLGFNGAAVARPRKWRSAAETVTQEHDAASMGPRSRGRGNATTLLAPPDQHPASMGPRSRDRGNSLPPILFSFQ